jgi:hypothetical protein
MCSPSGHWMMQTAESSEMELATGHVYSDIDHSRTNPEENRDNLRGKITPLKLS